MHNYLEFYKLGEYIMGCLCSKGTDVNDHVAEYEAEKEKGRSKPSAQLSPPEEVTVKGNDGSGRSRSSASSARANGVESNSKDKIIDRPKNGHRRYLTLDSMRERAKQERGSSVAGLPHGAKGEQAAAGWPPWLTSAAGEAVKGWAPRSADSYEKLKKVGVSLVSFEFSVRGNVASLTRLHFHLCRSDRGPTVVSTRLVI